MIVGINCGHTVSGTVGSGAVGFLNESNETRRVGYKVMEYLRAKGVTVVDCTDDYSSTVSGNLKKIVDKAVTFDITFWNDAEEVEPENGNVTVAIQLSKEMAEAAKEKPDEK